jgi:hypothetical protein
LEAETNKYCPGGYDIGAISNLITWVLNFFFSVVEHFYASTKQNALKRASLEKINSDHL